MSDTQELISAPPSCNGEQRLEVLQRYGILDTPLEQPFDDITRLAADLCQVPVAAISFIDADRQWFKSEVGLGVRQMPLKSDQGLHALLQPGLLIVSDTEDDPRLANNPLVSGKHRRRFYAGALLESSDGHPLGRLCVLDDGPRTLTENQKEGLLTLARQVMAQLELRRALKVQSETIADLRRINEALRKSEEWFRRLVDSNIVGIRFAHADGRITGANDAFLNLLGYSRQELLDGKLRWDSLTPPEYAALDRRAIEEAKVKGTCTPYEKEYIRKDGRRVPVLVTAAFLEPSGFESIGLVVDLTERRQVEEQLRSSQQFIERVVNTSPDIVYVFDMVEQRNVYANRHIASILGYTVEQIQAMGSGVVAAILHPDDLKRWPELSGSWSAAADEEVVETEIQARCSNGTWRWLRLRVTPFLRDRSGRVMQVLGTASDVTEAKETAKAIDENQRRLQESAEGLSFAMAAAQLGNWDWDAATDVVSFSARAAEIFGIPAGPVMTWTEMRSLLHEDDREMARVAVERALANRGNYDIEYRVNRPDGRQVWVSAKGRGKYDAEERITGMVGVVQDVTERKLHEQVLQRSEESFRLLFESVGVGKGEIDGRTHRFLRVNRRLCEITGYSAEELLSITPGELTHPEDRPKDADGYGKILRGEAVDYEVEKRYIRKDGTLVWVHVMVTLHRTAQGGELRFLGTVQDITQRKLAESLLAAQKHVLEMIAAGAPLNEILDAVTALVERQSPGDLCSVLLLHEGDQRLRCAAVASLPQAYNAAIDGIQIGPDVGSCGTAAYTKKRVIVADIASDPKWVAFKDLALTHGLRACWSQPIIARDGRILGTVANYATHPCDPNQERLEVLAAAAHLAGIAIERQRAEEVLRRSEAQARIIVEATNDAVWDWDLRTNALEWNNGMAALFGYPPTEIGAGIRWWSEHIHPDERSRVVTGIHAAIESGQTLWRDEYRFKKADGTYAFVTDRGYVIRDGQNHPLRMIGGMIDVSDERRTREALAYQSQVTKTITDTATLALFMMDQEGRCTFMNPAAEAMTGYSLAEVQARPLHDLIHHHYPDGRTYPLSECPIDRALPQRSDVRGHEDVFIRKDGTFFPVVCNVSPITRDGSPVGTVIEVRDVTEEKQAQDTLRLHSRVLESMTEGVSVADESGVILYTNRAEEVMFGYAPGELIGQHVSVQNAYEPQENRRVMADVIGELKAKGAWSGEWHNRRKDGSTFFTHAQITVLEMTGRRLWVCVQRDITEQKRAKEALAASESRLRAVLEASPECVKVVSPEGTLLYMNPAGLCMIESETLRPVEGACVFDLIAPEHRRNWQEYHARVCRGEKLTWQFEIVGLRGTRRWMETHAVPMPLPDGRTAQLAVTREITERKRAEEERERLLVAERAARNEAERASRLKDEFLATVSHELRTPLNAILGYSQLLRFSADDADNVKDGLEVIERNARVQTQIIEDLLDMSRIISGKLRLNVQTVDVADVVRAAVETVRHAAEAKGIHLHCVLDPSANPVSGDPARLQQVVWNLLSNAIKFTPKGGKVQVVLRPVNSHVEISVSDTGQGIKPEFLPYVFERFRQGDASTTRKHGGLGLGLSIVKSIVEIHGGTVKALSPGEGCGSTFVVSLPLSVASRHGADTGDREHPKASGSGPVYDRPSLEGVCVLVVDDELDARELVRRLLQECGADVVVAASAEEALGILDRWGADVIVSDIGMPNIDGYDFIRRVRARGAQKHGTIPAAALTAFARSEDRTRALVAGYQTHIAKPVEPTELVFAVASLVGRTGHMPQEPR